MAGNRATNRTAPWRTRRHPHRCAPPCRPEHHGPGSRHQATMRRRIAIG